MKIGQKVSVVRGGRSYGVGRYAGSRFGKNGEWADVNFAEPRKPQQIRTFRPSSLTPVK